MLCHSLCCVLPLVGWIVGLNLIGVITHAYEWVFISLNILAIIGGFYYTYPHKVKKKCDHDHCHSNVNKRVYWIATIVSVVLMILPHLVE